MKRNRLWLVVAMLIACLQLAACGQAPASGEGRIPPARVEKLDGADPSSVTLSEHAAKRLDIQITNAGNMVVAGAPRTTIPYSAIVYDTEGHAWTYVQSAPLTFLRHPVTVDRIEGDLVILSQGLDAGTPVVSVGNQELFGAESEFQEE